MSETLQLTVVYEDAGDGWTMARVRELPGVMTQGATLEEAREMIRSALRDWLAFYVADQAGEGDQEQLPEGARSESLALTIA